MMRRLASNEGTGRYGFILAAVRGAGLLGASALFFGLSACAVAEELDWPDEVDVLPREVRPDPQVDMNWLPDKGDGLTRRHIEAIMKANEICRLYVLKDGVPRLDIEENSDETCGHVNQGHVERYRLASVVKSIVSLLLGKTLDPAYGIVPVDIDAPARNLLAAAGIAFSGTASLRQLLQMSSGLKHWDDQNQREVSRYLKITANDKTKEIEGRPAFGRLRDKLVYYTPRRNFDGPSKHHYSGYDTSLVAVLVEERLKVGGLSGSLASGLEAFFWHKLPMRRAFEWKSDFAKQQPGYCCAKAHPFDLGELGVFVLAHYREGNKVGAPWMSQWVHRSIDDRVTTEEQVVCTGAADMPLEYGYQWWILPGTPFGFIARGFAGQFLHIMPEEGVVVVQFSDFDEGNGGNKECASYRLHRQIAAALAP